MKVLFISRGKKNGISPIINNQASSLLKLSVEIEHFTISGSGLKGYLRAIKELKSIVKKNEYQLFHAHYSFSGFVASLSGCHPLVISLMGSDIYFNKFLKFITQAFVKFFWKNVIVKSSHMAKSLGHKNLHIIPNGVNIDKYKPLNREIAFKKTGLNPEDKNILFIANPNMPEKNYHTVKESIKFIPPHLSPKLITIYNVQNDLIPFYMNAGDVLVLPSLWEGSPNVIKEALACNLPVVATKVGDIPTLIEDIDGCYLCENEAEDIAQRIELVLINRKKIRGREKIESLGLSDEIIASKIKSLYENILTYAGNY